MRNGLIVADMAFAQLLIVILACLCLHSLAQRWGLQPEILIMVVACAASFIPGMPSFQFRSDVILVVLLC